MDNVTPMTPPSVQPAEPAMESDNESLDAMYVGHSDIQNTPGDEEQVENNESEEEMMHGMYNDTLRISTAGDE